MNLKTILLILLAIGMVMFSGETLRADGPAEEVYEVMLPVDLPDRLSTDQVKMLVMLGVLQPEGPTQLGLVEGSKCHWVVTYCGGYDWCRSCNPGNGVSPCPCPVGPSPNTE